MSDPRRTALVTGAANGIGAAIAELLAARGLRVILVDRDERVTETAQRVGGDAVVADVTDTAAIVAAVAIEHLDVLVACAAIAVPSNPQTENLTGVMRATMEVNVESVAGLVGALLPRLRASASARILMVSSVQGLSAAAGNLAYVTSKGALLALTRALAVDLAPDGILVNAIAPGFVDTAMALLADGSSEYDTDWFRTIYVENGRLPLRRPAQPAEIAAAAEFFVSEQNSYVTGAVLPVDGGLLATF